MRYDSSRHRPALAGAGIGALAVSAFKDDSEKDSIARKISADKVPPKIRKRIKAKNRMRKSIRIKE